MIIDKLGSRTYTEHEIRYIAQDEIARLYSASNELNLQRKISGLALGMYQPTPEELAEIEAYKNHLIAVQTETAQAIIDNQLLIDTIAYENALVRLQQYKLSVGRPEQTVYPDPDDDTVFYMIGAIEPLPATIEQWVYSEDGNAASLVQVQNPLIVADEAERAEAQLVIDNVTEETLCLYEQRIINDHPVISNS